MSLRSGAGTARSLQLPASLFSACAVRVDLLHRVVEWQRARQRSGTATTLSRGQVSGTGRKPHPQKGSGRARQGTKRAPHHRGGGHAHAKKQREFAFKLNKKIRARGLAAALSTRLAQGRCTVIADTGQRQRSRAQQASLSRSLSRSTDRPLCAALPLLQLWAATRLVCCCPACAGSG